VAEHDVVDVGFHEVVVGVDVVELELGEVEEEVHAK
jgi:hypothetical protein